MKYRFKTEQEFKDQYGEGWKPIVGWHHFLDDFFGMDFSSEDYLYMKKYGFSINGIQINSGMFVEKEIGWELNKEETLKNITIQKLKDLALDLSNYYSGNIKISINTNFDKKSVKVNIEEHGL